MFWRYLGLDRTAVRAMPYAEFTLYSMALSELQIARETQRVPVPQDQVATPPAVPLLIGA